MTPRPSINLRLRIPTATEPTTLAFRGALRGARSSRSRRTPTARCPTQSRQRLRACASWTFSRVKEGFPVLALFGQRRRAVADLDPLHAAVVELTRGVHVAEVLVAGDRSASERAFVDRPCERLTLPGFDSGGDQVPHRSILPRGEQLDEGRERRVQLRVLRQQPELSGHRVRRGFNRHADDQRRSRGRAGHRRPGGRERDGGTLRGILERDDERGVANLRRSDLGGSVRAARADAISAPASSQASAASDAAWAMRTRAPGATSGVPPGPACSERPPQRRQPPPVHVRQVDSVPPTSGSSTRSAPRTSRQSRLS